MKTLRIALLAIALFGCGRSAEPDFSPPATAEHAAASTEAHAASAPARPAAPSGIAAPADVAAPPSDADRTPSGLASKVISAGNGSRHPSALSRVKVHYTGWTTDGKMFDSSVARGEPTEFPLNAVIAGWTEGLQQMVEGEKRRFWIPEDLAYRGQPGAPAGMLVFDVELLEIRD